jgi:sarcosine oxidase, subunit alpha
MRVQRDGAKIDRARTISFSFDGRQLTGHPGDTLASALLANGIHMVGRSFKYHRPRGIVTAGPEEPNALVTVGEGALAEANARATVIELYDGLTARSQNAWPSLAFDMGAATSLFSKVLPSGFYYKTFLGPAKRWTRLYEPVIRRMAGLGPAPTTADPEHYDKMHAHCDVLVIGAGDAGTAAAREEVSGGLRVILIDEGTGSASPAGVQMLARTTAFGRYDDNLVMAVERCNDHLPPAQRSGPRQRLWQIRAGRIVLATGAHQQPLVFANNDLPGVMLAQAGLVYLRDFGVLVGKRIVVAGRALGDRYRVLDDAGATVIPVDSDVGAHIVSAIGGKRVTGAVIEREGRQKRVACDAILMAGGWQPAVHLHSHLGGRVQFDAARNCFVPVQDETTPQSIGACAGEIEEAAPVPAVVAAKAFIDYQNDVTIADIDLASREGFISIEHLKRYTTTGMATDQGKLSNLNALHRLATNLESTPGAVGTTTFRPPYTPVTFGALAAHDRGDLIDPMRLTPMHEWHVENAAVFEDVGQWKRARFYPQAGEDMDAATLREGRAVRASVGMLDASTLGKIDIQGPDAAQFLNLVYTNAWLKLEVGRCRYGIMCGEDGMVFDDGVTARTGENRFLMTTTTGNAARVLDRLEDYLQTEWPHLKVWLNSVTEHWAAVVVTGPKARDMLTGVVEAIDLSNEAFPHLSIREGRVAGIAARLYRISFTGELSYEVHVPAQHCRAIWDALYAAGQPFGVIPYGTETMHILRAEKGYIIIGQETDGTVSPVDLGLSWAIAKNKPDFIGKRSLERSDMLREDRKQLVGLLPKRIIPEGAQLTEQEGGIAPVQMLGHVTSSYWSPALDKPFALALLARGRQRIGDVVHARFNGEAVPCTVIDPNVVDPDGGRMNG